MLKWLDFLNGKKTTIGAILYTLTEIAGAVAAFLPALQDLSVELGLPAGSVALVFGYAAKAFIYVGLAHKFFKSFFGLPEDTAKMRGYGRPSIMGLIAVMSGAILAFGACNKVPPNLSPVGATAFRVTQVVMAVDTIGDIAVKAERAGFIEHKETLLVADVAERSARAAADLGRALQAGEGQDSAKLKAVAIIRKALTELPDHLSQRAREIVQPYINVALAALAIIG
jgi:hypothetical protein